MKIKAPKKEVVINQASKPDDDKILFSFKYLSERYIKKCKQPDFFFNLLMHFKECETEGWDKMQSTGRHHLGWELIPIDSFEPDVKTYYGDIKKLMVMRNGNEKLPMAGVREGNEFRILYIATSYQELYKH